MYRFVLTGGPSAGKSRLLKELSKRGYFVVPEAALQVIREIEGSGRISKEDLQALVKSPRFQEMIYQKQIQNDRIVPKNSKCVIYDRCVIDSIGYCLEHKNPITAELVGAASNVRLTAAFLFDMLPEKYWDRTKIGPGRLLTYEGGLRVHGFVRDIYKLYGIPMIRIPFIEAKSDSECIRQRTDLIEMHLLQYTGIGGAVRQ